MNTQKALILLVCSLLFCTAQTAATADYLYTVAIGGARGAYGLDEDVNMFWLMNDLEVRGERWSIEAALPILRQNSTDLTWVGGMPMPRGMGGGGGNGDDGGHGGGSGHGGSGGHGGGHPEPEDPAPEEINTGIADPIFRFRFDLLNSFSGASMMSGSVVVKAPLGDETLGFSTGEWDYGAGLMYSYSGYRSSVVAELTYWRLGNPPDITLENPLAFRLVGGFSTAGGRYLLEAFLTGQTEIVEGAGGPRIAGVTVNRNLTARHSVFISTAAGLNDATFDYSAWAGFRIGF